MKLVILKGLEGFGDRLQCLLQAIGYAKATGRTLVVDWRDSHWSHDQQLGMEHYIQINGIETLCVNSTKLQVLAMPVHGCQQASVVPAKWKDYLIDPHYELYIRDPAFALPGNGRCLKDIMDGNRPDFEHDIVVYPGIGERHFDLQDAKHLRISAIIGAALQECVNEYQLNAGHYDIVHLRGGTKSWAGGSINQDNPNYNKHAQWESAHQYLQEIYDVLEHLRTGSPSKPLVLLTDAPALAKQWTETYGGAIVIRNCAHGLMGESGIHKITRESLSASNQAMGRSLDSPALTKELLNIEAIRDFILMTNSRYLVGDGVSFFSYLAYGFKTNNVILAELPESKSTLNCILVEGNTHQCWQF